jgi:hypothetical protein
MINGVEIINSCLFYLPINPINLYSISKKFDKSKLFFCVSYHLYDSKTTNQDN